MEKSFSKENLSTMTENGLTPLELTKLKIGKADFGSALLALKAGLQVARSGWNGKRMYLQHIEPYGHFQLSDRQVDNCAYGETLTLSPWIGMKTADNCFIPWLASQTDLLACDWTIIM